MLTRHELETALDAKRLYMRMHTGNWWVLRRNGKTQTWKTRSGAFRIPFKAGFRATGALTEADLNEDALRIGHLIGNRSVLVPQDMEVRDDHIVYGGCDIHTMPSGKTHQGLYIGPFVIHWYLDHSAPTEVGTLDAARKRIDDSVEDGIQQERITARAAKANNGGDL